MKDTTLFALMLGLPHPWELTEVIPDLAGHLVTLRICSPHAARTRCSTCDQRVELQGYEEIEVLPSWDVMQFKARLVFETVKGICKTHGPAQGPAVPSISEMDRIRLGDRYTNGLTFRRASR